MNLVNNWCKDRTFACAWDLQVEIIIKTETIIFLTLWCPVDYELIRWHGGIITALEMEATGFKSLLMRNAVLVKLIKGRSELSKGVLIPAVASERRLVDERRVNQSVQTLRGRQKEECNLRHIWTTY